MKNKIVNIIIFAVAILDCLLALFFAFRFDDQKKDNFVQAQQIQSNCPQLLTDLQAATTETLPAVVETYQTNLRNFNDSLNSVQLQKDILYTYLSDLKSLTDEAKFEDYKANFATRAESLFAKCDNKQALVDGFNKVNSINTSASETKKTADLTDLQNDLKAFKSNAKLENAFIFVAYLLLGVTVFMMLFFALTRIVKEFKTSYKILVVLALFAVIVFIGYAIGSPVLTPNAIKAGLSSSGFKMVNAAAFTLYVSLITALLAIIGTSIVSAVKNRK